MSLFIPVVAISDGLYEGEDESVILIGRPGDGETRVRLIPGSEQATFHLVDTDSKYIIIIFMPRGVAAQGLR